MSAIPSNMPNSLSHLTIALCILTASHAACETVVPSARPNASAIDAATQDRAATAQADAEPECGPAAPNNVAVPAPFAGRTAPMPTTPAVIVAGKTRFRQRCSLCHGASGEGDGREGPFNPPAANLTLGARAEDYLFWRISAGGPEAPFCSAMPAFEDFFSEKVRWELVAYVRSLAAGAGDASVDSDSGD